MGVIVLQKRMVKMLVLVLFLLTTIAPMIVYADHDFHSQPITVSQPIIKKTNRDSYDMIIIAPSSYSSALESFIQHKNNRGIVTTFVSVNDIYSGTQGRDNQEKIKYFIKDAIESWGITHVLFVGAYNQVPVRYCYNNDEYSNYPEPKFISDLYYADIYDENGDFSSWDNNNNEYYGEWDGVMAQDKPINLTPDVCLGRLPCKNTGEISAVVNKIKNYENQLADPSWFKRLVVAGGDTYQKFEGYEGEQYNQMAIDLMDGFTPVKLWGSNGKLTEKGWELIKEINQGCGFLYLSGHGSPKTWSTKTPSGTWIGDFSQFKMFFLFNRNKLPVCLVGGCHNSQFDTNIWNLLKNFREAWYHSTWLPKCWSWQLLSRSSGGSIATIGATGLGWYSCEFDGGGVDWLNIQFFREYSNDEKIIGKIWKNSLTEYMNTYTIDWDTPSGGDHSLRVKTVQEWALLGDPSLTIGGGTVI